MFTRLVEGYAPMVHFEINDHPYTKEYYLTHGIYPPWSTFMKTIPDPHIEKKSDFAKCQEAWRENVGQVPTLFFYCEAPFSYLVGFSNVRGQDLLCYHAQHDY
jgi:hypothetical protein